MYCLFQYLFPWKHNRNKPRISKPSAVHDFQIPHLLLQKRMVKTWNVEGSLRYSSVPVCPKLDYCPDGQKATELRVQGILAAGCLAACGDSLPPLLYVKATHVAPVGDWIA